MKKYQIVIEETVTVLRSRIFEADSLEDAYEAAEASDDWATWEQFAEPYTNSEIRDFESGEVK